MKPASGAVPTIQAACTPTAHKDGALLQRGFTSQILNLKKTGLYFFQSNPLL